MTERSALTLSPMPASRLASWIHECKATYADDLMRAGESEERATELARTTYERYFPSGVPKARHMVFDLEHEGSSIGYLWIGPSSSSDSGGWWVWDVAIDEGLRGLGYGKEAMTLGEGWARDHGATTLGLNVFGFNTIAQSLYESLGFTVRAMQMTKDLV